MTGSEIATSILYTVLMTVLSTVLAYVIGLPLGIILYSTSKKGIRPNRVVNSILGVIVNFMRSVPCLILTVLLLPVNRLLFSVGTGVWYTMLIPLVVTSFAYVARVVEQSLSETSYGVIEAGRSMGATDFQLITRVILVESRSSLLMGFIVTMVSILGYTSFAYNIGAGGLIADIWKYYTRHTTDFTAQWVFWLMVVLVVVIVQVIQELGLFIAKKIDKRRKV